MLNTPVLKLSGKLFFFKIKFGPILLTFKGQGHLRFHNLLFFPRSSIQTHWPILPSTFSPAHAKRGTVGSKISVTVRKLLTPFMIFTEEFICAVTLVQRQNNKTNKKNGKIIVCGFPEETARRKYIFSLFIFPSFIVSYCWCLVIRIFCLLFLIGETPLARLQDTVAYRVQFLYSGTQNKGFSKWQPNIESKRKLILLLTSTVLNL